MYCLLINLPFLTTNNNSFFILVDEKEKDNFITWMELDGAVVSDSLNGSLPGYTVYPVISFLQYQDIVAPYLEERDEEAAFDAWNEEQDLNELL